MEHKIEKGFFMCSHLNRTSPPHKKNCAILGRGEVHFTFYQKKNSKNAQKKDICSILFHMWNNEHVLRGLRSNPLINLLLKTIREEKIDPMWISETFPGHQC